MPGKNSAASTVSVQGIVNGLLKLRGCPEKTPAEIEQARQALGSSQKTTEALVEHMHSAIAKPDSERILKILVALGAPVDGPDENKWTPLYKAVNRGKIVPVRVLLKLGADPNGASGPCPLNCSAQNGNIEIVRLLVEAGARSDDETLRLAACSRGKDSLEVCKALLVSGAPVNGGKFGTPLMWACSSGNVEIARLLLEKGADINAVSLQDHGDGVTHETVLHFAMADKSGKCLELVLAAGPDTKVKDSGGNTPRDRAVALKHSKCVKVWDQMVTS